MLSYKTTHIIARNKETQEEIARYLVKGHGLFTVAGRECTAETCGTSEGEIPSVRGVSFMGCIFLRTGVRKYLKRFRA